MFRYKIVKNLLTQQGAEVLLAVFSTLIFNPPLVPPMKKIILSSLAVAALAAGHLNAQIIATDVASNYTTETWVNGSNLGSGFGAWDLFTSGTAGYFIGDSVAQGFGNVNTAGSAF